VEIHNKITGERLAVIKPDDAEKPDIATPASTSATDVTIFAGRINCRKPVTFFNPGNIS
jgi:hypothetical protein